MTFKLSCDCTRKDNIIPVVHFSNQTDRALDYIWSFNDGTSSERESPEHTFQRKGNYKVNLIATNSYGCTNTTTKIVIVENSYNLLAPTAFSPDGDDLNNTWIPKALEVLDVNFKLTIIDQYGKVNYQTQDFNSPWDGRDINGNIQFGKTFVWICIVKNEYGEEEAYKGTVTIVE